MSLLEVKIVVILGEESVVAGRGHMGGFWNEANLLFLNPAAILNDVLSFFFFFVAIPVYVYLTEG